MIDYKRDKSYYKRLRYKNKIKTWYNDEIKSHCFCLDCGETDPSKLQFHHFNPEEKNANIADLVSGAYSKTHILIELEKCYCLCDNCHDARHMNETGMGYAEIRYNRKVRTEDINEEGY